MLFNILVTSKEAATIHFPHRQSHPLSINLIIPPENKNILRAASIQTASRALVVAPAKLCREGRGSFPSTQTGPVLVSTTTRTD